MGMLSKPSMPAVSPELAEARKTEEARVEKEKAALLAKEEDTERKRRSNLLGQRSLQSEDIAGFGGFRRSKNMGKSIRS